MLDEMSITDEYHKPLRLMRPGHNSSDVARDKAVWKKAKAVALPLGAAAFDVVKQVLVELAKAQLHIPPG